MGQGGHEERDVAMSTVPGVRFIVVAPEFDLGRLETSSIAQRRPSALTKALIRVPIGQQVEKKIAEIWRHQPAQLKPNGQPPEGSRLDVMFAG